MVKRRDLLLVTAALGVGVGIGQLSGGVAAAAAPKSSVQQSALWDWSAIPVSQTGVGQYRQILRAPTATLDELEIHVTTLNPGQTSHAPHKHPNEELVILASGKLEAMSNGETKVLGPGSVIFNASNQMHSVRNVGDEPATYHVINWSPPGALKKSAVAAPAAKPAH